MKEGKIFKKEFNESIPWTVFQRARVEVNKILLNRQKMNEKEEKRKESELQEKWQNYHLMLYQKDTRE